MPIADNPRYRPARVRRLFERFDREFDRVCAQIDRSTNEVARAVMDARTPLPVAVLEQADRFGILDRRVVLAPEGLNVARIVEAITLAGRPREAARVAAGLIPIRSVEQLPGGSIFLLDPDTVPPLPGEPMTALPPLPARARVDLGPL